MAKGRKRTDVYYRVAKFEIFPDAAQRAVLMRISEVLRELWNAALSERLWNFLNHFQALYAEREEARKTGDGSRVEEVHAQIEEAYAEHGVSFFDQVNQLTPRRAADPEFRSVPRNWQEETLDTLNASFLSFYRLRAKQDKDARRPHERREGIFVEIPGRSSFNVRAGCITLSCPKVEGGVELRFPIPEYQQQQLGRAARIKKFTLFRDEPRLDRPGRYWVAIGYEVQRPETSAFVPEEAVYVALGGSALGVVSPKGEEVIDLWRPDKHWKPRIENVESRMEGCVRGSRRWKKRNKARRRMQRTMARQQLQNQREVVSCRLLEHGNHFVVTELVVRSKPGKLADGKNPDRGGSLGLNWIAQNTGGIARIRQWLEQKVKECGGSVRTHTLGAFDPGVKGRDNKITMARRLREEFLARGR